MERFWTMSLRTRLMIIGLAGVGIALIMGGLAFFSALTYSVNRTLDNEALASAEEVAEMVNENRLPSPVPVPGAQVVQVVDAQQRVIGGSVTADRLTPLLRPNELATALAGEAVVVDRVGVGAAEPLRIRRSEERRVGKECRCSRDWSSDVCSSDLRIGCRVRFLSPVLRWFR